MLCIVCTCTYDPAAALDQLRVCIKISAQRWQWPQWELPNAPDVAHRREKSAYLAMAVKKLAKALLLGDQLAIRRAAERQIKVGVGLPAIVARAGCISFQQAQQPEAKIGNQKQFHKIKATLLMASAGDKRR